MQELYIACRKDHICDRVEGLACTHGFANLICLILGHGPFEFYREQLANRTSLLVGRLLSLEFLPSDLSQDVQF